MPTYAGPGLLAGPYWDALEPDPANAFSPDCDASQGVLGMFPMWVEPMTPAWPRTDYLPWPGLMPIDQAPDDFGPLLPPGLRKPPWWLRPTPSMPPLLPPWAFPPPDVPRLPPSGLEPRPTPPRLPRVDDPVERVPLLGASSSDTSSSWAQPSAQFDHPLGKETSPNSGSTADLFGVLSTLPFQTSPYDHDFAANVMPTTAPVRDSVDMFSALAATDRGEPNTWAALTSPSSGVLDPTGLTYGPQSFATQAAYEGEPSNGSGSESEAGSEANHEIGEPYDETRASDQDQDYLNLAQAPAKQPNRPHQQRPAPLSAMSATKSGNKQVLIARADGTVEVRDGGTLTWRNNNPGAMEYKKFARQHGAIGSDGRFAIFPNEEVGRQAALARLRTPEYQAETIDGAIKNWAPPPENDTPNYQAAIQRWMGLSGSTPMSTLTQPQLERLYEGIRRTEVWKPGNVTQYAR